VKPKWGQKQGKFGVTKRKSGVIWIFDKIDGKKAIQMAKNWEV
jgi:hypothetical protein